jgi:Divergent InlB B-repeat domain/WD40-like Beta Propeller Repeat
MGRLGRGGQRSVIRAIVVAGAVMGGLAAAAAPAQAVILYVCTSGSTSNLCQINSDGSHETQLTSDGSYSSASLDPAGTRMVFDRGSALYAANGTAQNPAGPISNASSLAKISFDGTTGVDDEQIGQGFQVCTFATSGGSITECGFSALFPTFTPSGEIVASFLDQTSGQFDLGEYAVGATAAPPVLASDATGSLIEPAVSPDGQTLAVVVAPNSDTAGGYIALYSMTTGQVIRQLTNGTSDQNPAWSPDGTQLVFQRGYSLYTTSVNASPGDEKLLVSNGVTPTWGGPDILSAQTLTVSLTGKGKGAVTGSSISCPGTCTHSYASGTRVTLAAAPAAGSTFAGWSGACTGRGACTLTMSSAQSVTASFALESTTAPARPAHSKITKAKINAHKHTASFSFSARRASRFQCELIPPTKKGHKKPKVTFGSCRSPKTYKHLKTGKYTFLVRGVNSTGGDRTPARKTFKID